LYNHHITSWTASQELLRTYNIGVDDDERSKQMVEAVSRRVGLALPRPADLHQHG
jgi:hypothetical protein